MDRHTDDEKTQRKKLKQHHTRTHTNEHSAAPPTTARRCLRIQPSTNLAITNFFLLQALSLSLSNISTKKFCRQRDRELVVLTIGGVIVQEEEQQQNKTNQNKHSPYPSVCPIPLLVCQVKLSSIVISIGRQHCSFGRSYQYHGISKTTTYYS